MKKRRLYVLSVDAMITEDIPFLRTLPAFGKILKDAAIVSDVITVYPSLTYTAHASMITGCYPDRHHIINNELLEPNAAKLPWYRSRKYFDDDVKSVLEAAKEAGYTTGAFCWPVTADMDIDYHLPECWVWTDSAQDMYDEFIRCGAKKEFLDEFWDEYGTHLTGLYTPQFSLVTHAATLTAIRNHQPEVIFEHLSVVDAVRHANGVYAKPVYRNAYMELELMLQQTLHTMQEAGVLEDTTFVITSDHGQTPVKQLLGINTLLARDGLITLNAQGKIDSYRAYAHSCAHSAQVYVSDPGDEALVQKVYDTLKKYQDESYGIAHIFTREQVAKRYRVDGPFSFMLEGGDGTSFSNSPLSNVITRADNSDYKYSVATHGHMPEDGPKPAMILNGPGIRKGAALQGIDIVDEAPTLAALLGVSLGSPDGHARSELLSND